MTTETLVFVILNGVLSLGLSLFFYQKYLKDKSKWILIGLRFLSFFLVFTILYNFSTELTEITSEKPKLYIGVDNSKSMLKLSDSTQLTNTVETISNNAQLNEYYSINTLRFSEGVEINDTLDFEGTTTNISQLIDFYKNLNDTEAELLILTDGNQNLGRSIEYSLSDVEQSKVFALIAGDTTVFDDIKFNRVNANAYAFLNNKFPIESYIDYKGKKAIKTRLQLIKNGRVIDAQSIELKPNSTSKFKFETNANAIGKQIFQLKVLPITDEKNQINNTQSFGVEVIDNRYKILLLSNIIHPDMGMLKSIITSTNQYQFETKTTRDDFDLAAFDLIIAYQPDFLFKSTLEKAIQSKQNLFVIGGTSTDYNLLSQLNLGLTKAKTSLFEAIQPVTVDQFSLYNYQALNFESFPPLNNQLSRVEVDKDYQFILTQKINGIEDDRPLWMLKSTNNWKISVLFGENIWKWRSKSYQNTGDFKNFDRFIDQHLQFLANTKRRKRLEVDAKPFYNKGESGIISAQLYDANYVPRRDAKLNLSITNTETKAVQNISMVRDASAYQSSISSLDSGSYSYKVTSGAFISTGEFKIIDFDSELQFNNANYSFINSAVPQQQISLLNEPDKIIAQLIANEPPAIQKSFVKKLGFIEIKYLLGLIILTLSIEWFLRKYKGLT